jgi:hypothetical protein
MNASRFQVMPPPLPQECAELSLGKTEVTTTAAPAKVRLRLIWRAATSARGKAEDAELRRQFMNRARSSGLVDAVHQISRHGEEDVMHALDWALKGRDPWGSGEFDGR